MLWLWLFALPPLTFFLWWAWRKRNYLVAQFVRARLLAHLTVGVSKPRQKIRMASLVGAVACLILALARPQWGFTWEEAKQRGRDIIVAIDTSRSMLAEDVAPNRLGRAKLAALDLARRARTDRVGLVAFAGTAFLQCPLTLDEDAFRQTLDAVDVGIIPQGGTAIAEAIDLAAETFRENKDNDKALVLFTDGEDHDSGALAAAKKAAPAGVRIFTIGVGTPEGELLRQRDANGSPGYIKDADGNVVKSHLNETLLREIATAAKGFYLPLRGANTVDLLYERGLAPLAEKEIAERLVKRYHERFQWPLSLAIALLLLEMFLPDRKLVRRPEQPVAHARVGGLDKVVALFAVMCCLGAVRADSPDTSSPTSPSMNHAFVVPPLGGLRGVPVDVRPNRLKAGLPANAVAGSGSQCSRKGDRWLSMNRPSPGLRPPSPSGWERAGVGVSPGAWVQRAPLFGATSPGSALQLYQRGKFDEARDAYDQLLKRKPHDPRLRFNAGAAAYQARKYDEAGKDFGEALRSTDLPLQQRAYYNLGNTLYRLGEQIPDPSKKSEAWEEAAKSYEAAVQLDPHDADAKFNLDLVKKRLEELKKQQSQSQKSQDKNSEKRPDQRQTNPSQPDQNQSQTNSPSAQQQKSQEQAKADQQRQEQEKRAAAEKKANAGKNQQDETAKTANQSRDQTAAQKQSDEAAANATPGQMTPQQARQLLDAARNDEKALIFVPPDKAKPQNRPFKDW